MRPDTTRAHRNSAPDYDDASFWDARFATGQDVGEWLNPGGVLLDALLSFVETRSEHATPRVLHLGPGVSKLGQKVRDAFVERGWAGNGIVNADFSAEAVRLGKDVESRQEPSQAMKWTQTDLRSWADVSQLLPFAPFDAIVDKSTSDAIATSSAETLNAETPDICPAVKEVLDSLEEIEFSPIELLGLHLAPLMRKGSQWFVLSYSTARFGDAEQLSAYWEIVARTPVEALAPQKTVSGAFTPPIYHYLYTLQRK